MYIYSVQNYGSLELVLVYPHQELIMHILSVLGNDVMVVQLVFYSVSICRSQFEYILPTLAPFILIPKS